MSSSDATYIRILRDAYDRDSDTYDERFRELQLPKYTAFLEEFGEVLSGGGTLLDLGCGTGLLREFLSSHGHPSTKIVGVDIAPRMLIHASRRGVYSVAAEIARLPFACATFSMATCITVLRIFPVPELPMLEEVRRVLKPGGRFFLSVLSRVSDASLRTGLRAAGFKIERMRTCGQDIGYVCRLPAPLVRRQRISDS
ncbi:MAG: class I SAM-dependent methyltransferase [Deltaproteobacteria bacterium]|nr:MAG: class I SAM-dependent methyltransferase [Deltaproteobacteria bacterium]